MISLISRNIKKRDNPNDVFITPVDLAKKHISMIDVFDTDIWFDPFKNSGVYYNNFPTDKKDWTEILEDKDFFLYSSHVDIICSNPPYSCIDTILEKSVSLNPKVISYLIGINNLTTRRMEMMEKNGYGITKIHICKVYKWYGMSCIVVWEKNKKSIFSYDRTVWR